MTYQIRFVRMSGTVHHKVCESKNIEAAIAEVREQFPGCLIVKVETLSPTP